MKQFILFFLVIILTISVIPASAQTQKSATRKPGTFILSKDQFEKIKAELNALPKDSQLKRFLAYIHDADLYDMQAAGDKRWVNVNGPIMRKFASKLDSVKSNVGDVAIFSKDLDEKVANIETVITGDGTPVTYTEVKTSTVTKTAAEIAMEEIRKNIAERRKK